MTNPSSPSRLFALTLTLTACGGAPTPAPADSGAISQPSAAEPKAESRAVAWSDDLSKQDKGAYMKSHVLPKMKGVFQSASAERYTDFGCATCHGTEWKDAPRDALPKLKMKDGKFDVSEDKASVVQFMMKQVVPEMATLLGKAPYDPKTNSGFGCAGCHVVEM